MPRHARFSPTRSRWTPVPRRPRPRATVPGRGGIRRPVRPPAGIRAPRAPSAPGAPKPGAAAAPAAPVAPDPRDSTYWQNLAKLQFTRNQQQAQLTQEQAYADTDFAEAVRRRLGQKVEDVQNIRQGANREGLFYSGQLGKRQGDYEVDFQRREADAQTAYTRANAAREAARQALAEGYSLDEAAAMAEAVDRQSARDLASPPDPPGAAAAPPAAVAPGRVAARPRGSSGRRQPTTTTPRRRRRRR